ncbi:M15 family metallopeptidase [Photorhabdus heterorhabditis]|uniref:M15 family metallopeptidase n=1 Tax=Photorhabdus heterorhabditis TaxID=880156 RepID=A0A5B0WGV4_9GAMM|nr:M15 family metallopeptidase [Photorhabdus heterorhabditis]KAA1186364.1 M15 family metallopeptidase [Photorhabdus heterorhabditis]KOY63407.1 peptidase M15 [Photorhabdus heterorhabditis]MBS9442197.1 D-alanyl-D-alanine carboxypeptidase family protein [Photorhabdus heterorhabditis]
MTTANMLTGLTTEHLVSLSGNHQLQPEAAKAFLSMQQAAASAGFNLQPASTFRDFQRQQTIWNGKFRGKRPVLDENSQPMDITPLTEGELCKAILRWSALPGASRHHWGTELDIYDPTMLPENQKLQLEPWEYEKDGYFEPLTHWLTENMAHFGFYRPFVGNSGIAYEPWHISYRPLSEQLEKLLTEQILLDVWQHHDIAGIDWLSANLPYLFENYLRIPQETTRCNG